MSDTKYLCFGKYLFISQHTNQTTGFSFFLIAMPWVACPGYGSSLTVQEHEKQSVLRLTQIRFEGFEKNFPTGKNFTKTFLETRQAICC